MISWILMKLTKQSINSFRKQLKKKNPKNGGRSSPQITQTQHQGSKLDETHLIKHVKLSWSDQWLHNILHWQTHWCLSSPYCQKTEPVHITHPVFHMTDQLQVSPTCILMAYGYTLLHTQTLWATMGAIPLPETGEIWLPESSKTWSDTLKTNQIHARFKHHCFITMQNVMVHDIAVFFQLCWQLPPPPEIHTLNLNPADYISGTQLYHMTYLQANNWTDSNVLDIRVYAKLTQTYQYPDRTSCHQDTLSSADS